MAKVHTESVTINFSRLVKNNEDVDSVLSDEVRSTLEQVAQELVTDSVIVEVEDE
jgi:hypothetical protein